MKNLCLFSATLLLTFISYGQSANRQLDSFDAVQAQEGIDVYLTKGNTETARIEADGIAVENVLTEISGSTLKIHLEGNNHRNVEVSVYVTYKSLSGLSASSSASIKVDGEVVAAGDFDVEASSSGSVELTLKAKEVEVDISSSGTVRLDVISRELDAEISSSGDLKITGTVDYLEVQASSAGDFGGYDLSTKKAEVRASSGASVKLTVTDELQARASSGASVRYKGEPRNVNADSSSGGSVRKS